MTQDRARKLADKSEAECLARRIGAFSRMVGALYDGELAPFGITRSQFGLLTVAIKYEKVSPTALVKLMRLDKSTLSRNLRLMEKDGLLKLTGQGRSLEIQATEKGREVYCKSAGGWDKAQARLKELLTEDGILAVSVLSSKLASA